LDKTKISAFQMALIMYSVILATGIITLPGISAQYADNDFWMTPLIASIPGILAIFIAIQLHRLYPKLTFVQYSERIVGKIPGKVIGFVYFCFFVHTTGIVSREYSEFVTGNYLFKTPMLFLIILIILLAAIAVRGGVELLARSAVIFTPILILPLFFMLLLMPDFDLGYILPILRHGMIPVFKGSALPMAWFSEFFIIAFFLPSLSNPEKSGKWSIISLVAVILSLTYVNLVTLFVMGPPETADKVYPILTAFRYISRADFFENLEALLLAMWVLGNFIKIAALYYAAVLSLANCFNQTDYRPFVLPVGLLIIIHSFWDLPSYFRLASFLRYVGPFYLLTYMILIPLLLLIVAVLRKNKIESGEKSVS
jgi:spore germination protein KB